MSRFSDEINQRVHNELCRACPHSKQCHEDCTTCDDFNDLVQLYLNGQSHLSKENLEKVFLNKRVHVIIRDPWHPIDADGIVTKVDDACQLHGTWGGLAAIPPYDWVSLINDSIGDVGIDFVSVHDDYGTVVGKCFIYSNNSTDEFSVRTFNYNPGSNSVIICRLVKDECFTDSEFNLAESILLENLKANLDLSKVPTLNEWLKNNKEDLL